MLKVANVKAVIAGQITTTTIEGLVLAALVSTGTSRQGTAPRGRHDAVALSELERLGLIGKGGGLTRRGSYAYLDVQEQIEAALGW